MSYFTRVYSDPRDAEIMQRWSYKQFYGRSEFTVVLKDDSELHVVAEELKIGKAGQLEIWSLQYGRILRPGLEEPQTPEDWVANHEEPIGEPYLTAVFAPGEWRRWTAGKDGLDTTPIIWWTVWDAEPISPSQNGNGAKASGNGRRPISWATRQFVKERDAYRCKQCGTHMNLTVDHVIPVSAGGTNAAENLQTLCQSCNSKKGGKPERA